MKKLLTLLIAVSLFGLTSCDETTINNLADDFGVPNDFTAPTYTGPTTINVDNTVIEDKVINSELNINADNVIIRDSLINTSSNYGVDTFGGGSVLIEGTDIRGQSDNSCDAGTFGPNVTLRDSDIAGCEDGAKAHSNFEMDDSLVHHLDTSGTNPHADGVQIRHGDNIWIHASIIFAPYRASNAAFQISEDAGPTTNVLIEGNTLSGGNYIFNGGDTPQVTIEGNALEEGSTTRPFPPDARANSGFLNTGSFSPSHCGNAWFTDYTDTTPYPEDAPC